MESSTNTCDASSGWSSRPPGKTLRGHRLWQRAKRVNAIRRRFQKAKSDDVRDLLRMNYSAALAQFHLWVAEAKANCERKCHSASSRGSVFLSSYREAFGINRPPRLLPLLKRADGSMTTTHLESAVLLLETQIVADDLSNDLPEHAEAR
ncbi:hypothetical protein MRX96_021759 [Rhipicephalus microplus]